MSAWTLIYAVSAGVCLVAGMCTNLLSERPRSALAHAHHAGRWVIVGGCSYALARVLTTDGDLAVWPEQAWLMLGIALVIVLRAWKTARQQCNRLESEQ
jgi:hypothetical protein